MRDSLARIVDSRHTDLSTHSALCVAPVLLPAAEKRCLAMRSQKNLQISTRLRIEKGEHSCDVSG